MQTICNYFDLKQNIDLIKIVFQNLLQFKVTPKEWETPKLSKLLETKDALVLDTDTAKNTFTDITNIVNLFPSGYLLCYQEWLPLRASYDILIDAVRAHFTLLSFREHSKLKVQALSFSCTNKVGLGSRVDVFYYDVVPSPECLKKHIIKHVNHAASVTHPDGKVNLLLHFPLCHDIQVTKEFLKPFIGDAFLGGSINRENGLVAEAPLGKPVLDPKRMARL